ncbi:MAG: hypothetical protein DRN17_00250 [Thermoplasmata archaeon]|nr:MAG: hypothetical protein DRN17_00250 [Thermoplasmata archaeon]
MNNEINEIIKALREKYGINSYFYPGINLMDFGGIEREVKEAQKLAQENGIEPDLEFYKEYLDFKKKIINLISEDNDIYAEMNEYSEEILGSDISPILFIALDTMAILFLCVIKPYCEGYFHRLGELDAEKYRQAKKNISKKLDEIQYERDKEIIALILDKFLDKYNKDQK